MPQEPPPPPQQPSGPGKPGFFQSMNGVIAGLTGLVIALGSLAAAWNSIFPSNEEQEVANSQAEDANTAEAAPDDSAAAATAIPAKAANYSGNLYVDKAYGGDAVTLEDNGENWVLTVGDEDPVDYEEVKSSDPAWITAYSKDREKYLSWPIAGGQLQEGNSDKDQWTIYGWVDPPSTEPDAAS
jgi:hypothetical protein